MADPGPPKKLKSDGIASASSYSSKVHRDFRNLNLVKYNSSYTFPEIDNYAYKYTLEELAFATGAIISSDGNKKSPDQYAESLVTSIIRDTKDYPDLTVKLHPPFTFNQTCVDELKTLYDSDHNKADVAVWVNNSNLVNIEVNSSPISETVKKVTHGLIELLRVAKAHSIDQNLQLRGFALPKLEVKGLVVRVDVSYDKAKMLFISKFRPCEKELFKKELCEAVVYNLTLLKACQAQQSIDEGTKRVVLYLAPHDMVRFGKNAKQCRANMGLLFEAEVDGVTYCFKKPLLKASLFIFKKLNNPLDYRIHYEEVGSNVFQYRKVKYDPLRYEEAEKCLPDLIQKVYKAIDYLFQKEEISHNDLRLPNICFNDNFDVVFIDFDFAGLAEAESTIEDIRCFAEDLVENIPSIKTKKSMGELCEGKYEEELLKSDFASAQPVRKVIENRSV